jgi:hypothetical protein
MAQALANVEVLRLLLSPFHVVIRHPKSLAQPVGRNKQSALRRCSVRALPASLATRGINTAVDLGKVCGRFVTDA